VLRTLAQIAFGNFFYLQTVSQNASLLKGQAVIKKLI
jgi:hypothetical protein